MMAHLDPDLAKVSFRDILRLLGAAFFAGMCLGVVLGQFFA